MVDDDQSINSIFEFILNQAGYTTITTNSGEECLEVLKTKKNKFDFPRCENESASGIETFKKIKKLDPLQLVIMMTGYSVDELLKEAFELGAYGVIYKPFDVEEVLSIIEKRFKLPATQKR